MWSTVPSFRPAPSLVRMAAVLLLALSVAGCQTAAKQVETIKRPGGNARIVLMPLDVELAELSASGMQEPKADWTEAGRAHLAAAFQAEQSDLGLQIAGFDEAAMKPEVVDTLHQLQKLHAKVGHAILMHHFFEPLKLPSKRGKFDWSLGPSARALREATGADYALFVWVRDSYSSGGRVALMVAAALLGVSVQGGSQIGFASLVDLENGDIVWFNRLLRGMGDLRTAEPARETAKVLLTEFPK
ncbi:hypothetical protein [Azospirillum soli]|uniref:hypothetical protein n=1 Tax=Azospirillum soli TaxID=1304799 RepID=UPI001AE29528|nr:hypothetical protein [Azospirillum soli]MBP2313776.1 hypothetical protein [Azospirillum soli]